MCLINMLKTMLNVCVFKMLVFNLFLNILIVFMLNN